MFNTRLQYVTLTRVPDYFPLTPACRRQQLDWRWNRMAGNLSQVSVSMFTYQILGERRNEPMQMQMHGKYMSLG